jgi:hypothetical protein
MLQWTVCLSKQIFFCIIIDTDNGGGTADHYKNTTCRKHCSCSTKYFNIKSGRFATAHHLFHSLHSARSRVERRVLGSVALLPKPDGRKTSFCCKDVVSLALHSPPHPLLVLSKTSLASSLTGRLK